MKWIEIRLNENTELFKIFLRVIKTIPDNHPSLTFTVANMRKSQIYRRNLNDPKDLIYDNYRIECQYNEDNIGYDVYQEYIESYEKE